MVTRVTGGTGVAVAMVHDLVELSPTAVTELCGQAAQDRMAWVAESLDASAWAVVRRTRPVHQGNVPIGIRGPLRHQRWAAEVPLAEILRVLSPSELAFRGVPRRHLPAFRALSLLQTPEVRALFPGQWGPGGSVGAELASGVEGVHAKSDLDLVVRVDAVSDAAILEAMSRTVAAVGEKAGVQVDVLVETPDGGIHLTELLASARDGDARGYWRGSVVARTPDGPALLYPWGQS